MSPPSDAATPGAAQRSSFFPGLTQTPPPAPPRRGLPATPAAATPELLATPAERSAARARASLFASPPPTLPPALVVSFPAVRSVLWDAAPAGAPVFIRGAGADVPEVELAPAAIPQIRQHAEQAASAAGRALVLRARWRERAGERGSRAYLEILRIDSAAAAAAPPAASDVCVPLAVAAGAGADADGVAKELARAASEGVEAVGDASTGFLQNVLPAAARFDSRAKLLRVAVGAPAAPITLTPINPPRVCRCALSDALARFTAQQLPTSGFVTLDQSRKALPLQESEARTFSSPLVGVWVSGVDGAHSLLVHAAAVRFACTSALKDKATQQGKFLVMVYTRHGGGAPECYEAELEQDCSEVVAYIAERGLPEGVEAADRTEALLLRLRSSASASGTLRVRLDAKAAWPTPAQLADRAARKAAEAESVRSHQRATEALRPKYERKAAADLERELTARLEQEQRDAAQGAAAAEDGEDVGNQPMQPWMDAASSGTAVLPSREAPFAPPSGAHIPGVEERSETDALASILERFGLRDVEALGELVAKQEAQIDSLREEVAEMRVAMAAATAKAARAAPPALLPASATQSARPAPLPPAAVLTVATRALAVAERDLDELGGVDDDDDLLDEELASASMLDPDSIATGSGAALTLTSPDTLPTIVYEPLSDDDLEGEGLEATYVHIGTHGRSPPGAPAPDRLGLTDDVPRIEAAAVSDEADEAAAMGGSPPEAAGMNTPQRSSPEGGSLKYRDPLPGTPMSEDDIIAC